MTGSYYFALVGGSDRKGQTLLKLCKKDFLKSWKTHIFSNFFQTVSILTYKRPLLETEFNQRREKEQRHLCQLIAHASLDLLEARARATR